MNKIVFLGVLAALSAGFAASAEERSFDHEHSLWKKSSPRQVFIDRKYKAAGESSIRIENGGMFSRVFKLKPDTEYELTFFVKGRNIASSRNQGGRIMLHDGQEKWGRITSNPEDRNKPETGTFDWRQGKGRIKSSDWGETIKIELAIRGKGTIWFDEVQLTEVKENDKDKNKDKDKAE